MTLDKESLCRAVFLDRDGVLIEEKHYLHRVEDVRVLPGVPEALKRLQKAGFLLIVVTNQSGVGRGYYTMSEVNQIHGHLLNELKREGVCIRRIYVAPEAPGQPSRGRKPSPQFLLDARDEFGIELARSFMIGDKKSDLECGVRAGVQDSILVKTGYGAETAGKLTPELGNVLVVQDLTAGAEAILSR